MANGDDGQYSVQVLGPISVVAPDGPVDPGGPKPRLLLALLVTDPGHTLTTEQLIDGLWGDEPPTTARKTVQVHVSNLRRSLGAGFPLETSRAGYRVDPAHVTIDAVEFARELAAAEAATELDPASAVELLASALGRWRGPPYADVAEEPAMVAHAARLTELRIRAVEQRIDAELRLGRHERVLGELESLTVEHPYRERLRALQMLALYRAGRQTEALRAYERCRIVLGDELGIDPGRELRALHQQVLEQSSDLDLVPVGAVSGAVTSPPGTDAVPGAIELAPGVNVRGYELREPLGARAGGVVFRAYQPSVGREVALKVIDADDANEPGFVKRFDAGCRRLIELEHPHIVRLIDHWRDPSGAFMAMPLLGGGTLEQTLADGPLPVPQALQIVDQVGAALAHAHRRHVVHGDIRPSNVLLDADGNAYLSDFLITVDRPAGDGPAADSPAIACDIEAMGRLVCTTLTGVGPDDVAFAPIRMPSTFGAVIRRATEPDPCRRYERVDHFVRDVRRCFGADVVSTAMPVPAGQSRNPYKGLRAFREADASDYFGRTGLIDELIARVRDHHLTVVVGPSGSGKSSLVHAGLVPAVRRGSLSAERDVVIVEMFPGAYPFDELATALLEVGVRRPQGLVDDLSADDLGLVRAAKQVLPDDETDLVLVIDQFEELFALTADESIRKRFIDALVGAVREQSRVRIVVTLRADFFGRPLSYPEFGALMRTALVTVALPGDDELAEAIAEPARRVGLDVEPGLVPTILRDVADEPGSLPMLQYALTELADQRDGDVLTIEAYRRTGGVVRALATRAEEIYAGLPSAGRDAARAMFVRLVSLSDEADDTRRRVRRSELDALGLNPASLQAAIDAFGAFRLLTFDHDPVTRGPTIEVAHEALIREWPRLRTWIDEQRDDLRTERRLASAVGEWRQSEYESGLLISGVRLERYEQWAESTRVRLTEDEQSFILQSRRQETDRRRAESARRRRVLTLMSVLVAVAVAAAVVALVQRNRADDQARAAEEQSIAATEAAATADALRQEAEVAALVTGAQGLVTSALSATDPDTRVRLAQWAAEQLDGVSITDPIVESALYQSIVDHRIRSRVVPAAPWPLQSIDPAVQLVNPVENTDGLVYWIGDSRSGDAMVFGALGGDVAIVADASTGVEIGRFEEPSDSGMVGSSFDWSTGNVLTGFDSGEMQIWRPNGELLERIQVSPHAIWPMPSDAHSYMFIEFWDIRPGAYDVVSVDRTTGDERFRVTGSMDLVDHAAAGDRLLIRRTDGSIAIFDTTDGADITPDVWRPERGAPAVARAAIESDGRHALLLLGTDVARIDTETGATVQRFETGMAEANYVEPLIDGEVVVVGAAGSPSAIAFDVASGRTVDELSLAPSAGPPEWYDWSTTQLGHGRLALAMTSPILWEPGRPGGTILADGVSADATTVDVGTGGAIVVGDDRGRVGIFESNGRPRTTVDTDSTGTAAVVSADGSTMIVGGADSVSVVDVATGVVRATGPEGFARPLGVTPDGSTMIVATALEPEPGSPPQAIELVDARTGAVIARIGSLIDGFPAAVSSDGSIAAVPVGVVRRTLSEPANSAIWLIDMSTGDVISRGPAQECIVGAALSSDDRYLATVGCDGNVSLFDVELLGGSEPWTARLGGTSAVPTPGVGVVFGPDDDEVIVARTDGTITSYRPEERFAQSWHVDVGDHVGAPTVHDRVLWVTAASGPEGLPSTTGVVLALPLDHDDLVELARMTATRELLGPECELYLAQTSCSAP